MAVEIVTVESRALADNPLGDPATRELGVYLPAGYDGTRRFPVVMVLSGYTGNGPWLLNRSAWTPGMQDRLDRCIAAGEMAPCIAIFPDCWTRYGGSQYVDSPALGRYLTYLCEEVVPFVDARYRTIADPAGRAVVGKSSGGFGALHLSFERPGVFAAAGCHAGDSAFELNYATEFSRSARLLEKLGGLDKFFAWFDAMPQKSQIAIETMSNICSAAAWSPNAGPYGYGQGFDLPFDVEYATLVPEVWARWLAFDPVRRVDDPAICDRLRILRALFLDAGRDDEYGLQHGMRQLARKLRGAGVAVTHEEFDGGHRNTNHRYERSIAFLVAALATS